MELQHNDVTSIVSTQDRITCSDAPLLQPPAASLSLAVPSDNELLLQPGKIPTQMPACNAAAVVSKEGLITVFKDRMFADKRISHGAIMSSSFSVAKYQPKCQP
ncbi:hypothetical protein J6590_017564 [Homalodisca vitripennis]|nr:hypothetical protein J6590_017564 [Homalodisca vitripennis]